MARFKIRPSKFSSILGVVVGIGILIAFLSEFGGFNSFPSGSGLSGFNRSFGIFGLVFVIALVSIIGYHIYNASTGKGYDEVIDLDESDRDYQSTAYQSDPVPAEEKSSVTERLLELKQLRSDGLITDEEFETKRQEIIKSL